jgi:hypothetical protein
MASRQYGTDQIERLLREYESGTKTRAEFCRLHGIPVTTLDYWRLKRKQKPRLVEVAVETPAADGGFWLVLANGRRIECCETELARLIRIAESL